MLLGSTICVRASATSTPSATSTGCAPMIPALFQVFFATLRHRADGARRRPAVRDGAPRARGAPRGRWLGHPGLRASRTSATSRSSSTGARPGRRWSPTCCRSSGSRLGALVLDDPVTLNRIGGTAAGHRRASRSSTAGGVRGSRRWRDAAGAWPARRGVRPPRVDGGAGARGADTAAGRGPRPHAARPAGHAAGCIGRAAPRGSAAPARNASSASTISAWSCSCGSPETSTTPTDPGAGHEQREAAAVRRVLRESQRGRLANDVPASRVAEPLVEAGVPEVPHHPPLAGEVEVVVGVGARARRAEDEPVAVPHLDRDRERPLDRAVQQPLPDPSASATEQDGSVSRASCSRTSAAVGTSRPALIAPNRARSRGRISSP